MGGFRPRRPLLSRSFFRSLGFWHWVGLSIPSSCQRQAIHIGEGYAIWQLQRWRRKPSILSLDERSSEKSAVRDVEADATARPTIPVAPPPGVGWTPQIRSISCSLPAESSEKKSAALPPKRARSPPPTYVSKLQNPFADPPYPKSAPAHTLSFSDNELRTPATPFGWESSRPVTPHALSVSGMQTRSLSRPGQVSKNSEV